MNSLLELTRIFKFYGSKKILEDISFSIEKGKIYGLYGPNGAGKSTIIKILSGETGFNKGKISFWGESFRPTSSIMSLEKGIVTVHQNTPIIKSLSILENIYLWKEKGIEHLKFHFREIFLSFLKKVNTGKSILEVDGKEKFYILVCKALLWEPRLLIFDESTNLLSKEEKTLLFSELKPLFLKNSSLLLVSHNLEELIEHCDYIIGIKKGRIRNLIERDKRAQFIGEEVVALKKDCFGQSTKFGQRSVTLESRETIIEWRTVKRLKEDQDINISLHRGEFICLLADYNSHKLLFSLIEQRENNNSTLCILGKNYTSWTTVTFRKNRILYIADEPLSSGFPNLTLDQNLIFTKGCKTFPFGILKRSIIKDIRETAISRFDISPTDPRTLYSDFSGGNQQKINIAREFDNEERPEALIAYNITKGLDEASRSKLLDQLIRYNNEGIAIFFISVDKHECESMLGNNCWKKQGPFNLLKFQS